MITLEQLRLVMPRLPAEKAAEYLPHLVAAMEEAQINTPLREAAFLAQLAHESDQLKYWHEGWGPTEAQAKYEGRKDLGNINTGDGRRYLGRGPIQLTGRANYRACGLALGILDLEGNPEQAATPQVGFRIAAWYWTKHKLNAYADAGDFLRITKAINGGTNGLESRQKYYVTALEVLGADGPVCSPS